MSDEIGWPTPEEDRAQAKALEAARAVLLAQTPEQIAAIFANSHKAAERRRKENA
jgi:hypothetical protein